MTYESELEAIGAAKLETQPHLCSILTYIGPTDGEHRGTGFFTQVNDHLYVVTAAHVVFKACAGGHACALGALGQLTDDAPQGRFSSSVQIVDAWFLDRNLDLAVARVPLADQSMVPIPTSRIVSTTHDIQDLDLFVHGFPGSQARFLEMQGGMTSTSSPVLTHIGESTSIYHRPEINFPLSWPGPETKLPAEGQRTKSLPDPAGMSGSPVWRLDESSGSAPVHRVYGVATHHDPQNHSLLVTRAEHLRSFLLRAIRDRQAWLHWTGREQPEGDPLPDWTAAESDIPSL